MIENYDQLKELGLENKKLSEQIYNYVFKSKELNIDDLKKMVLPNLLFSHVINDLIIKEDINNDKKRN